MSNIVEGIIRGKTIELQSELGFEDGQRISIAFNSPITPNSGIEAILRTAGARTDNPDEEAVMDQLQRDRRSIPARFVELKFLKDGWLDGLGQAPSHEGLDWLASLMAAKYPDTLPLPYAYPVAEGGVQLEWPLKLHEASLEIDLTTKVGAWHVLNVESGQEEERSFSLEEDDSWDWMIGRLSEMAGAV